MASFYDWTTSLDESAVLAPDRKRLPFPERVKLEAQDIVSLAHLRRMSPSRAGSELHRLGEEYLWALAGRPYYKIHPRLVSQLCKCNLSNVPTGYLEVPGGFDTALIRFSEPAPELSVDENEFVRCILMSSFMGEHTEPQIEALLNHGNVPHTLRTESQIVCLRIDFGNRGSYGNLSYINELAVPISKSAKTNLENEFATTTRDCSDIGGSGSRKREVVKNCLRLISTVGLVANSPQDNLLEFDVLAKDRKRFESANEEVRQSLISRARRRGKHGWNVGTNEMFVPDVPKWSDSSVQGERGQHSHAHIRTGHLHAVRCGPGRKDVKIKWFRPTVVRPDLPFAST